MKYKSILNERINDREMNKAKYLFVGFVLILAFIFFSFTCTKVSAAINTEIVGSIFDKDENGTIVESDVKDGDGNVVNKAEFFEKVDLTNSGSKLTFVQGNGQDDQVAIKFNIYDFPSDATSFIIVESDRTDSSSLADADRYSKDNVSGEWEASDKNVTKNGLTGKVSFSTDDDGKINVETVYRLRKGSFGIKFFKIYFYKAQVTENNPTYQIDVVYVIAQPIDLVEQNANNCTTKHATEICVDYDAEGDASRVAKPLKIYIPTSVAYNFKVVPLGWTFDSTLNTEVVNNYNAVVSGSTIYGINYFDEDADGTYPAEDITKADRTYLYTNITMYGMSSQDKTDWFIEDKNENYTLVLDSFTSNEIDYFYTEVDSIGKYVYYIKDIFGNVKEVSQDVTNVKNRAVIVDVKKGNASNPGYNATETFTNESVEVALTMTVETHFELGVCLNNKCTDVTNLTQSEVDLVKYWRVDVEVDADGNDPDAYKEGKTSDKEYAFEKHAATGSMHYLYCRTTAVCESSEIQSYSEDDKNKETGAGYSSFDENVLKMYVAVNGRYRFYIEDRFGNNTLGEEGDLLEEEYRNPRVEVYAIDKKAPELTFEHDATKGDLKSFDIETCKYYQGITLISSSTEDNPCNGVYEYDGRVSGTTEAIEKKINDYIYYPLNRDSGRTSDTKFNDSDAITMSKVRVSEYVYYYDGTKDLYADYTTVSRTSGNEYVKKLYDGNPYDNSINTILLNVKHNSNGLKLTGTAFAFKEINYYHNDGKELVCDQISAIEGYEGYKDKKIDCVNYYIDHGVDFIIEFVAEDFVGNIGKGRIYVDVYDTTPPGFVMHTTEVEGREVVDESKLVRGSNIGTDCRMEIGQEIGSDKKQNAASILNCYNVDINESAAVTNKYNFEDNVYDASSNDGLSFANLVNDMSHVKLYILSDKLDAENKRVWLDLKTQVFIPNKTGYYDLKIVISDNADIDSTEDVDETNTLTILVSYYVDRKM